MTTGHPLISLRDVGVCYRHRVGLGRVHEYHALRRVSFDVLAGDSVGVIGRNGAGKSTLLRILAGIIRPDRGTANFAVGCHTALLNLRLGFEPMLSGRDNAILGGMMLGMSRHEVLHRLDEIIDFTELEAVVDEPLHTYSTGMCARLGFAVAIQARPDVLLIDEVLGVGDTIFQRKARTAMQDIIRSERTVVLVSHSAETIRNLCNRAVWIEDGTTRLIGTPADVMDAYTNDVGRGVRRGAA